MSTITTAIQQTYIQELIDEIAILDPVRSMYTIKLLQDEIYRVTKHTNLELCSKQLAPAQQLHSGCVFMPTSYSAHVSVPTFSMPPPPPVVPVVPSLKTFLGTPAVSSSSTMTFLGNQICVSRTETEFGKSYFDKWIRLSHKVIVPVDKYPRHNFIGKIMGPKRRILKKLQEKTNSTIFVLGKGSIRDNRQENHFRESGDPMHAHLKEPLHVLVSIHSPESTAEQRLAVALTEVYKYMDPNNAEVREETIRIMAELRAGVVPPPDSDAMQLLGEKVYGGTTHPPKKATGNAGEELTGSIMVNLSEKIIVPVKTYPGYNFIGKIMGVKRTILKELEARTNSSILILGKGSLKDKDFEKLLREGGDTRYAHLNEPLHIVVKVYAASNIAEKRLADAVTEVNKYMDPDNEEVNADALRALATLQHPRSHPIHGGNTNTPIVRVGIPGQSNFSLKSNYIYDGKYDGTYEGYPSTSSTSATTP